MYPISAVMYYVVGNLFRVLLLLVLFGVLPAQVRSCAVITAVRYVIHEYNLYNMLVALFGAAVPCGV